MSNMKSKIRESWYQKAASNAYHWVDSTKVKWSKDGYYRKVHREVNSLVINFLKKK